MLRDARADRRARRPFEGDGIRRLLVLGSLVAGVVVALGTSSVQTAWLSQHRDRGGPAGAVAR